MFWPFFFQTPLSILFKYYALGLLCLLWMLARYFFVSRLCSFEVLNVLEEIQAPLTAPSCLQAQRKFESQFEFSFDKKSRNL